MTRRVVLFAVIVLLAGSAATAQTGPTKEDVPGVVNFVCVSDAFASAGATTPEAMLGLKAKGYTVIVNLRSANEANANLEAEAAAAKAAGLRYVHIPTVSTNPLTEENVAKFLSAISDANGGKVVAHCGSGNRVSAFWLIKRVRVDKWPVERAVAEAQAMGLGNTLKDAALQLLK